MPYLSSSTVISTGCDQAEARAVSAVRGISAAIGGSLVVGVGASIVGLGGLASVLVLLSSGATVD